ncbi:hypothetical protein ONZ51_g2163 [Trametes cubensis]|uniref:Uncharacterized protein n=1 Tax=Trametes cubensis TaxID=1111947 RepID=A0AAD7U075_9APHY|nr:hypothetical protein ONZ51_g2163 [Trametes cubensis]
MATNTAIERDTCKTEPRDRESCALVSVPDSHCPTIGAQNSTSITVFSHTALTVANSLAADVHKAPNLSPDTPATPNIPPPRTPSPNGSRVLHTDPLSSSRQQSCPRTTSPANTAEDELPVPNQPFSPNDASPAGKKSYYQPRNYASVQQPEVKEKRRNVRLSMNDKTIIVEYDEFMEWFVPAPPGEEEPTNTMEAVDLQGVATTPELKMYQPLVDALNQDWLLPNDKAISNPNTPDPDADTDDKIDAGLYQRSDVPMVGKKTRWAYMELSIECKTEDIQHDPFDESSPSGDASAMRQDILGQIMCYSG